MTRLPTNYSEMLILPCIKLNFFLKIAKIRSEQNIPKKSYDFVKQHMNLLGKFTYIKRTKCSKTCFLWSITLRSKLRDLSINSFLFILEKFLMEDRKIFFFLLETECLFIYLKKILALIISCFRFSLKFQCHGLRLAPQCAVWFCRTTTSLQNGKHSLFIQGPAVCVTVDEGKLFKLLQAYNCFFLPKYEWLSALGASFVAKWILT